MDTVQQILQWALIVGVVVYCVMPLVLFAVGFVLVRHYVRRLASPDERRLAADFAALRAAHPDLSTDQLVRQMIRRQAFRCGLVGAITGLGGFFTLIIGLPIDILASLRLQASMVQFIALAYGRTDISDTEIKIRQALILSGGRRVAASTSEILMGFAVRFVGESLSKFIPLLGAVISFAVDYTLAQTTGRVAQKWYSMPPPSRKISPTPESSSLP